MMAEALRRAAADSGAQRDVLAGADAVRVVSMFSRRYRNPARLVAERIGAHPRDEALSPIGGNEPQALVSEACLEIAAGDRTLECDAGTLLTFARGETRSVRALEQARILIVLAPWPGEGHFRDGEVTDPERMPANAAVPPLP